MVAAVGPAEAREQAQRAVEDCRALLAEGCPAVLGPPPLNEITFAIIEVSFEAIADLGERESFLSLPTTFALEPELVDKLIQKGGGLLRQSSEFKELVERLH